jgi:A/G-specific adenine glycosylase
VSQLARRLLPWFERHGRHDLPWQRRGAYAAWVSEIMLQQTQVATVMAYYERFIARFPDVRALAAAPLDEVLAAWAGLGYYARARNLHRAARRIVTERAGALPECFEGWRDLPGVGRSTAGAIMALAHSERYPILDGNVKRVLVRLHGIETWSGETATLRELWKLAERHTPSLQVAEYTQAIMDLGATLCTRARPRCGDCPLQPECIASQRNLTRVLPRARPRRVRPRRESAAVLVQDALGRVLLERRPARGLWGGLFSLPELPAGGDATAWVERALGATTVEPEALASVQHAFTHFDLVLRVWRLRLAAPCFAGGVDAVRDAPVSSQPVRVAADACSELAADGQGRGNAVADRVWYELGGAAPIGLPAPIKALIERVSASDRAATISGSS